jgi:hypothetical protein
MATDVNASLFFASFANTSVSAVLTGTGTLPASITPSQFVLAATDALYKAQISYNTDNGSLPNVVTVSGQELGQTFVDDTGKIITPIYYTVGGKIIADVSGSEAITIL